MRRALSLIEVMVSMLLLGVVVAGMYATFNIVGKGPGKLGSLELQGVNYARETLEKLKNAVSTDPVRCAPLNAGVDINDPLPVNSFTTAHSATRMYTVEDKTGYKRVTVTVRWVD